MGKLVAFRVDSTIEMGTGHLVRCLTLAGELRRAGAAAYFISRKLPGGGEALVRQSGFELLLLPEPKGGLQTAREHERWLGVPWKQDAAETSEALRALSKPPDWLIVDHYGIDDRWESLVRTGMSKLMVIDDLADRKHMADLLLDQNVYPNMERRYDGLVPQACLRLLGPLYALVRPEFLEIRRPAWKPPEPGRERLLVFLGGADAQDQTSKVLRALNSFADGQRFIDVVIGSANPHRAAVVQLCAAMQGVRVHQQTQDMAVLMSGAHLAIGGGGTTTWERCLLGLPSITLVMAQNQRAATEAVAAAGATINLGWFEGVREEAIQQTVLKCFKNPTAMKAMSKAALGLMGGNRYEGASGVSQRMLEKDHAAA